MTRKEKVLTYLLNNGYEKADSPNEKYSMFKLPLRCRGVEYYFVGENGGVRVGKNIAQSISITEILMIKVELWLERREGKKERGEEKKKQ